MLTFVFAALTMAISTEASAGELYCEGSWCYYYTGDYNCYCYDFDGCGTSDKWRCFKNQPDQMSRVAPDAEYDINRSVEENASGKYEKVYGPPAPPAQSAQICE